MTKTFRFLGIYLGCDKRHEKIENRNCSQKMGKERHATTVYVPEERIIKRINSIFYTFLWRSPDKIKTTKIVQPVDKGGLNTIDTRLFYALNANWVNRIMTADPSIDCWVQLPKLFLKKFDVN